MQCPVKGMLEANQLEYRPRLCERSGSDVKCATLSALARKIRSLDASGACRMNGTGSGVASELQPDEQVVCQDLSGELSNSLSEIRKEMNNWKTKWRHVFQSQTKVIEVSSNLFSAEQTTSTDSGAF